MKLYQYSIFVIVFVLFLVGCEPSEQVIQQDSTQTQIVLPTKTNTFVPSPTFTLTPSPTNTLTPTQTFTMTPTIYPLSLDEVLAKISLQEEDLITYYQEIDVSTDGFVDGSVMQINRFEECYLTSWNHLITGEISNPENVLNKYCVFLETNRVWENRAPLSLASHSNIITVFKNAEEAHDFFINDISNMEVGFKRDMQTIGDESVVFSGYLGGTRPLGGVVWRYQEVYILLTAELKYQVTPDALVTIALNIQNRLVEALN